MTCPTSSTSLNWYGTETTHGTIKLACGALIHPSLHDCALQYQILVTGLVAIVCHMASSVERCLRNQSSGKEFASVILIVLIFMACRTLLSFTVADGVIHKDEVALLFKIAVVAFVAASAALVFPSAAWFEPRVDHGAHLAAVGLHEYLVRVMNDNLLDLHQCRPNCISTEKCGLRQASLNTTGSTLLADLPGTPHNTTSNSALSALLAHVLSLSLFLFVSVSISLRHVPLCLFPSLARSVRFADRATGRQAKDR